MFKILEYFVATSNQQEMPSADENYELKEQLGQGTFGSVYKAYVVSEAQCQKRNLAALTSFLLFSSLKKLN